MSAHVAVFARLSTYAPLTALVGTRIYPGVVPEIPTWPAISYTVSTMTPDHGALSDPVLAKAMVMVSVRARTQLEAIAIVTQVSGALDRYRQVTINGVKVDDCFLEDVTDMYEFDARIFHMSMSFRMHTRLP